MNILKLGEKEREEILSKHKEAIKKNNNKKEELKKGIKVPDKKKK